MTQSRVNPPLRGTPPRQDPVATFTPMPLCVDCGGPFVWVFSPDDDRCEWCAQAAEWERGECFE